MTRDDHQSSAVAPNGFTLCPKCDGFRTIGHWDCPACGGSGVQETPALSTNPRQGMTRDELAAYARLIADRTGLAHWKLDFPDEKPAEEAANASVQCWHARHGATVRFGDALLNESPEEQRYCVVHEIVHCHLAHADELAEKALSPREWEAWHLATEYGVDAIASVIAPFLPLPAVETNPGPDRPE